MKKKNVRFSITLKLFMAIITVCLIMAIGIGIANHFMFDTGFLDYLGEQEQAKLDAFAENLADDFTQKGSWEYLENNPRLWQKILSRQFRLDSAKTKKKEQISDAELARRTWEAEHIRSSLGLHSADKKKRIAGAEASPSSIWLEIKSDSGTVGWLTREPLTTVTNKIDLQFQEQQATANLGIIALALLTTAIVSIFLARGFLAPLRRLSGVMSKLATGDLSARADLRTDDELSIFAEHLNQLASTLQKNEQARRTFLAEISHDLRTPLAILRGEIEAMEDGVRPVTQQALSSLRVEVSMLSRLVDDIHTLALNDLGTLAYQKEALDLQPMLQQYAAMFAERLAEKDITLLLHTPEEPLLIYADSERIGQLIHNLLENSLRYTDPQGSVIVNASTNAESIILDIQDSAPGISQKALANIFERFYTCDTARNRHTSGSGLGLAICYSIVTAHNGAITAHPAPAGGLWIRITLPKANVPATIDQP